MSSLRYLCLLAHSVSNIYCLVFLFCFSSYVASFSVFFFSFLIGPSVYNKANHNHTRLNSMIMNYTKPNSDGNCSLVSLSIYDCHLFYVKQDWVLCLPYFASLLIGIQTVACSYMSSNLS